MQKSFKAIIQCFIIISIVLIPFAAHCKDTQDKTEVKILFIGNSLTYENDIPQVLKKIAESKGEKIYVDSSLCFPGYTLKQHWDDGIYAKKLSEKWDYVVLQEHGSTPLQNKEEFFNYVRLFNREIKNINAKTVLYITSRSGLNGKALYDRQTPLTQSYEQIANEIKSIVVPSGIAWVDACAAYPDISLYQSDDLHPSGQGAYLTACVFYAVLFNQSPEGVISKGLVENDQIAQNIQKSSWETVKKYIESKKTLSEKVIHSYSFIIISCVLVLISILCIIIFTKRVKKP